MVEAAAADATPPKSRSAGLRQVAGFFRASIRVYSVHVADAIRNREKELEGVHWSRKSATVCDAGLLM
ncbi:hypothetical protein NH8B_1868 [Pseudogulbenkiania sp. NH8B]|uniref:hypothetical protein n=1 Tax=Pseudogulbenkiania sp. (strain NH8B) TaxID=748280 RepID=UPI0002279EED|nr:hypothetical protein [Pseudogulbenkiania sp. NH8B]BAK76684.1 hypothetical protein NH8B_1868 [Pseudogulbenkiania sp. NH8B]